MQEALVTSRNSKQHHTLTAEVGLVLRNWLVFAHGEDATLSLRFLHRVWRPLITG